MEYIRKGIEITTEAGCLVPTGFNGHIVYCDEYAPGEESPDEFEKVGERKLTLLEIAREMKRVDGRNHRLAWNE